MALTFIDKQKNGLIKKFHTLIGKANIGQDGKEAILSSYGVESTKDLTVMQLIEACNAIELQQNPQLAELDKARKRLIAAIGGWLRSMGMQDNIVLIKKMACRAAKVKEFNDIPAEQLRSLYGAFGKKTKDLKQVEVLTVEALDYLTTHN